MKKAFNGFASALMAAAVLAGCAAGSGKGGIQPDDLRNSTYFITEFMLSDMDFPGLQRNLYQHRAACGTAPRFVMQERETSLATLIETSDIPQSYENVIIADLIQYPESWRASNRVAVRVYSYYYNDDVQQRLDRMLDAVRRPGTCEPVAQ
ncbi:hypothetical protein [Yanghanlia caeni]|uniref:Lipoprotein n=1 Tax=Yanghanlia caeni TaxID=3064283 RepID=A0ABU1D6B6_9BURK|nr:hypothetical protein [Alcaligenaceae bacterium LG-2]